MGYWRAAAKFAWRDLRLSRSRPAFLLAGMAISVACIGGVRSAANVARAALHRDARAWLAGDLAVSTGEPLDEEQTAALNQMRPRGIAWTVVTTALTMGASGQSPDPSLLAVKAVDPAQYPLYGALTLSPPQPLAAALTPGTVAVSRDALARFQVRLGDAVLIGGTKFRISATIESEPDRFSGLTALGVRCLLSQAGFARSGLARAGDSARFRILLRLQPGADWAATRDLLRELFPEGDIMDFRDANRDAVSILETTALVLNLTVLLAMLLGAIGVAMAVRQHIEERAYTLAIMKTIGGRNRQLAGMFFLQIAWLAAIALLVGLPLGWGVRASVLSLAARSVALPPMDGFDSAALFDAAAAALVALAPALVGTFAAIARLKPAMVLRRDFEDAPPGRPRVWLGLVCCPAYRLLTRAAPIGAGTVRKRSIHGSDTTQGLRPRDSLLYRIRLLTRAALIGAGTVRKRETTPGLRRQDSALYRDRLLTRAAPIGAATVRDRSTPGWDTTLAWAGAAAAMAGIATRLLGSRTAAAILIVSLAASAGVAFLIARLLLIGARRWTRAAGLPMAPLIRHGIANLGRPGNGALAIVVALAIGCMMMIATFQINRAVTQAILESLPFDRPDLLVPAIEARRREEVRSFLERQPGVEKVEIGAQARVRMATVDGVAAGSLAGARFRVAGCAAGQPNSAHELTVSEDVARQFGLGVGSRIEFAARGRTVTATVTEIRRMTPVEQYWYALRMDCSALDPASLFYHAAARIEPNRIPAVRRAFIAEYPAIPLFTADDLAETVGQVSHAAILLARVVAWYALGSSLAVMMAVVAASRGLRLRELAILVALGARRRTVLQLYTIEFAAMGVLAGSIGSLLAYGFTAVAVSFILRGVNASFDWKTAALATIAAGLCSVAAGWLPSYGLVRRKPLEVLRGE